MANTVALVVKSRKPARVSATSNTLARWEGLSELDERLTGEGVAPLSHFVYADVDLLREMLELAPDEDRDGIQAQLDRALQQPPWHDPIDGLRTIWAAFKALPTSTEGGTIAAELKRFEQILLAAKDRGDSFRFEVG